MQFSEQLSVGDRVVLTETGEQAHKSHHKTEHSTIKAVVEKVVGDSVGEAVADYVAQSSFPAAGYEGVIEEKTGRWWGKGGHDYKVRWSDGSSSRHLSKHLIKV